MENDVESQVVVGRQPVFDRRLRVIGYELRVAALRLSGDALPYELGEAGCTVLSALNIGMHHLVGDRQLFLRADPALMAEGSNTIELLPAKSVVIVGPELAGNPHVAAGCRRLVDRGHSVALHGEWWRYGGGDLLSSASVVTVDMRVADPDGLAEIDALCRENRLLMLADRIYTDEQRDMALAAGADFLQGVVVGRPSYETSPMLGAINLDRLKCAAGMLHGPLDFDEIETFLRTEPGLTFQVLQLASLGRPGETRRRVRSVREALVVAGSWRVQSWIAFLVTRTGASRAEEAVTTLARARACELLALSLGQPARTAFTAGMIAAFVTMLHMPAEELAQRLPLSEELYDAAFGTGALVGRIVQDVGARVEDGTAFRGRSGLSASEIDTALGAGFRWALDAFGAMEA